MNNYFFTFGSGHHLFPGYARIKADTIQDAVAMMNDNFGRKWCTSYRYLSDVDRYDRQERIALSQHEETITDEYQMLSRVAHDTECTVCYYLNERGEVEMERVIVDGDDFIGELSDQSLRRLLAECVDDASTESVE